MWAADGVESTIFSSLLFVVPPKLSKKKSDDILWLLVRFSFAALVFLPIVVLWHVLAVVMDSFVERKRNSFDDVYVAFVMIKIYSRNHFIYVVDQDSQTLVKADLGGVGEKSKPKPRQSK